MSSIENLTNTASVPAPLPLMVPESEPASLPKHLARLPGGQWALWRWVALRGAGFSADQMLQLADVECVQAVRQLIDAEDAAEQTRRQTVAHFKRVEEEADVNDIETRTGARKVL